MIKLEFKININAPRQKVWETMLGKETYKEWTGVSWPSSYYEGEWEKGNNIRFISPDGSGKLAQLIEHNPFALSVAKHVAVLNPGGTEDRESETAKGWIGTKESYTFTESKDVTELKVRLRPYLTGRRCLKTWPTALKKLKEMCER